MTLRWLLSDSDAPASARYLSATGLNPDRINEKWDQAKAQIQFLLSEQWREDFHQVGVRIDRERAALKTTEESGGDDPLLSHIQLANRFNCEREATRKKLDRWRSRHADGWIEVADPGPKEPKYLFYLSAVRELIE